MTAKTTAKVAPDTPDVALDKAVQALIAAAQAYAASQPSTVHSAATGDYRVRFAGGELLSLQRT